MTAPAASKLEVIQDQGQDVNDSPQFRIEGGIWEAKPYTGPDLIIQLANGSLAVTGSREAWIIGTASYCYRDDDSLYGRG